MPRGHVQVLLNKLRGFSAQASLDAPRFCISAGLPDASAPATAGAGDIDSEIYVEEGISEKVVEELRCTFPIPMPNPTTDPPPPSCCLSGPASTRILCLCCERPALIIIHGCKTPRLTYTAMGHSIEWATGFQRGTLGRGQIIQQVIDPSGRRVWACGSDLRADGHAVAQI